VSETPESFRGLDQDTAVLEHTAYNWPDYFGPCALTRRSPEHFIFAGFDSLLETCQPLLQSL
jgi:hypothetical protein